MCVGPGLRGILHGSWAPLSLSFSPSVRTWQLPEACIGVRRCSQEEVQEEFGWKLVHGDVFRPPKYGMLLSVMVGSGVQLLIMMLITLFFACLGFLSPSNRGALITCSLVRVASRLRLSPIALRFLCSHSRFCIR